MPFVQNQDVSIYYTIEGSNENPPLVLMHWFMGSHQTWYDIGWVRVLQPYFHLILIDHRGYGRSDKPHYPEAYQLQHHVRDIETVLDDLQVVSANLMGYSMGGRIGFAMAAYAPHRINSMVLGGMHPFSSDRIPTDLDQRIALLKQGMEITLKTYAIGPQAVFDRMMENDAEALLADTQQTKQWEGLDEQLKGLDTPILLFVGKDDGFYQGMRETDRLLRNSHFVAFPDENHRTAFLKRPLLLPHLSRFFNIKFEN